MSKVNDFLRGIQEMGNFISDRFYFNKLKDTPDFYQSYSGDYLVVNDNESGIHFTGIEKIAQDLTDYGFLDGVGGGGSSATTQSIEAAHISANGAIINQTNDWIDSVDVVDWFGPDGGKKYVINFKTNYFSVAPAIVVTPKHVSNVTHVFAQYSVLDSTKCEVAFQDYKVDISDLKLTDFCIIAAAAGGGGGGGTTNAQELTEQISQTIVNDNLIVLDTDYSFQTKYLNGSISSDSNITDLEVTNLTIGDTYRLSSTVSINSDGTAGDKIKVNYYHDGNKIAAVYSDNISQSVSTSVLFNATSNSLLVSGQNLDANNYIEGNPNEITFTQIEKISNNMVAPEIIAITDGSTQTFDGATMADNNYIKIEGENVSATIEIDGDSFVVAQSGDQMVWDQGGTGETALSLGDSINVTLSNGRVIEIKFYRSGSLYFAINKKSEPTQPSCVSSPVTITVESEYISPGHSEYKYTTSDSNGNGGLFGCIDVNRGETLTIFVTGDEPNLLSHPLKITNYNDLGQAMAPLSGVVKTDLTEGPYEDHTYSLTWEVPCDEAIDKYQYQCENHAGMRGTINVLGVCPSPTPTPTATVTPTPSITPTITPTPSVSAGSTGDYFDTFNSNEEMFLPITLE